MKFNETQFEERNRKRREYCLETTKPIGKLYSMHIERKNIIEMIICVILKDVIASIRNEFIKSATDRISIPLFLLPLPCPPPPT